MGTTVKTIGASGADYTTLQSWEDAAPANLVTDGNIWQGQIKDATDAFSGAGTQLTIAGSTVDATHYKELTTAAGASFRDNASIQTNALRFNSSNGCSITGTGGYCLVINITEDYVHLSNLQVAGPNGPSTAIYFADASSDNVVDFCIAESVANGHGDFGLAPIRLATNTKARNCLMVSRFSGTAGFLLFMTGGGIEVTNCTIVKPSNLTASSNAVRWNYASSGSMKNCAIFGASNAFSGTAGTVTTCYTDDATPPTGCTTVSYDTSTGSGFENITDATRDYRIKSGSALIDVGTTDSTNAANDIAKTARPSGSSYDVGCWEFVSGATPAAQPNYQTLLGVGA